MGGEQGQGQNGVGNEGTDSGSNGIFSFFGSDKFANFGKGLEGIGSIGSIGTSIYGLFQTNKALKLQKQALNEAQKQNAIENERYDKREAERIAANDQIAASASAWNDNPMTRE